MGKRGYILSVVGVIAKLRTHRKENINGQVVRLERFSPDGLAYYLKALLWRIFNSIMTPVLIFALSLIMVLGFASSSFAGEKPVNYNSPDPFLAEQFAKIPEDAIRVNVALSLIRGIYPDWTCQYEEDVFDCTEMTEYVRYFFRKCGIHADYMQSNKLWHTWLEVPTSEGDAIIVETTTMFIVPEANRDMYKDFGINRNAKMHWSEIDWWNCEYLVGEK